MAHKRTWEGASRGSALGNRIFVHLVKAGGPFCAYPLLAGVSLHYACTSQPFRASVALFRAHAGLPVRFRDYYRHAFSYGMNLVDGIAVHMRTKTPFRYFVQGRECADRASAYRRGLIILSAHIGNWEFAGRFLATEVRQPVSLVMLDNERPDVKEALRMATERRNTRIITVDENGMHAVVEIRKALANNEIVCMLGDRSVDPQTARPLQFMGAPANFPVGPFAIAAITGAPILPMFSLKTGLRAYSLRALAPLQFEGEGRQQRDAWIAEAMQSYVSALESLARAFPYQWGNFYNFWA